MTNPKIVELIVQGNDDPIEIVMTPFNKSLTKLIAATLRDLADLYEHDVDSASDVGHALDEIRNICQARLGGK